jgi:hypothetical protein
LCVCAGLNVSAMRAQTTPGAAVGREIDAAVQHRVSNVAGISDIERYDVYRGGDETHPVAEITVKATYRRGVGRSYKILSQSGSSLIRKFGLIPLLKHEKSLSQPGNMEHARFTTANYSMKLKSHKVEPLNGRECYQVAIIPRHKAPNAIEGTLWVDAKDFSIVKVEGVASRRPSILAGTTHMMREYKQVRGYAMATRARAISDGFLIGRTVVTVEYSDYHLLLGPTPESAGGVSVAEAGED